MMGWLFTRAGNLKKAEEWMDYAAKTSPDSLPVRLGVASWLLEARPPRRSPEPGRDRGKDPAQIE